MKYLLMMYRREADAATATPEQTEAMMSEYFAFTEAVNKRGVFQGGEGLHDTNKATTVRTHNDKHVITDGPFAETKEQLGGYYLIDCKDLDEAIEIAKLCPGSKYGAVEVRPVMEFGN
jgi:hypothetical protein